MEKKPRLRAPNFTTSDNLLLCDVVAKYKEIIENKKTDGANLLQKQKAWTEVQNEYNSATSGCSRTLESLQQTYKNLKKKAKKNASDKKMDIPVDRANFVSNMEECGTSSGNCDWRKVAKNVGASEETCQEMFFSLTQEANVKDRDLKKKIMGTGGGPPPTDCKDPVLEKVKGLVGPVMDGIYTIYDGDRSLMETQNIPPIELSNLEPGSFVLEIPNNAHKPLMTQDSNTQNENYFTNDRANLKRKPHQLLTRNRKLETDGKQTVTDKFKSLATEKMELVALQKQLLKIQIQEEKDKAAHNHLIREMEIEGVVLQKQLLQIQIQEEKDKAAHNRLMREMDN